MRGNERKPRGKFAGKKLGSAIVKENIYDIRKNEALESTICRASRKAGRWSSGRDEVEVKSKNVKIVKWGAMKYETKEGMEGEDRRGAIVCERAGSNWKKLGVQKFGK